MSWIAYYAPLKPPDHPTPSGDREMARNLQTAIARATGLPLRLASHLRSRDGQGDAATQDQLIASAAEIAHALITEWSAAPPRLWATYHNYYKAPDLIGPQVAQALSIPYVLIEATRARKRLTGDWARFAARAEAATDAANVVFYMTLHDRETLERDRPDHQALVHLPPFLMAEALPDAGSRDGAMLSVGMTRPGDKLDSYRLIAQSFGLLTHQNWRLDIAGDGPAMPEVARLMRPFGDRVRFLGALSRSELDEAYGAASLFLWPGVNEAYGMVYLEAQAAGLPIVAQNRPGVRDVLSPPAQPSPDDGPNGLARRIDTLLSDAALRRSEGDQAREYVTRHHLLPSAIRTLTLGLKPLLDQSP